MSELLLTIITFDSSTRYFLSFYVEMSLCRRLHFIVTPKQNEKVKPVK